LIIHIYLAYSIVARHNFILRLKFQRLILVSEHNNEFPQFYVTSEQPCPYLKERLERKLFTHLTPDRSPSMVDNMLRGGFRRSQHIAYLPYCDSCSACVSVRVPVDIFSPSRSQRRALGKCSDLVPVQVEAKVTNEHYDLFRDYIDHRHGDGGMADMTVTDFSMMVEDSTVDTHLVEYRPRPASLSNSAPGPLVAAALIDQLSDGLSMVYSYFDPRWSSNSMGTYMVLNHIERTRQLGLPYLYLGYWIEGSKTMDYKTRFLPQQHLTGDGWKNWTE
jgi:arginine-tRNA-protein transferase